jgi:para-nitrobenzyl esterase
MGHTRFTLAALALAAVLAGCGGGSEQDAGSGAFGKQSALQLPPAATLRQTAQGPVTGREDAATQTYSWLGLPYAKPPVGALRWMPPVDPEPWTQARAADRYGASCAQMGRTFSPAPGGAPYGLAVREGFGQPVGAEDCLTLNIWRPATPEADLPVIVFVHGGSNISGYAADPIYDGAALAAKAKAVVVTINYRLGLFGWLDMAQLKTGEPVADSGNFGTLDQIQALKYVKANIAAFGGNPGKVTLAGESAGAVNTWALLTAPAAGGLFHRAVAMSGGILTAPGLQARAYARSLLQALLIADGKASNAWTADLYLLTQSKAQVAAYLRGQTSGALLRAEAAAGQGTAPPVFVDGHVLPLEPHVAILAGRYHRVPMLAGNTREEGKLFGGAIGAFKPDEYERFGLQYQFDPDAPPTLAESDLLNPLYLPVDKPVLGWNAAASVLTLALSSQNALSLGTLATQQPGQIWGYRFDWAQQPAPFNTVYGAGHAMDLPFFFGNFGPSVFSFGFSAANRPGREALSEAMMGTLGAFAATGNPQGGVGVPWPNWPSTLVFDASREQARIRVE